jgi:hypothetical protein
MMAMRMTGGFSIMLEKKSRIYFQLPIHDIDVAWTHKEAQG